jgi:hypothetical protein
VQVRSASRVRGDCAHRHAQQLRETLRVALGADGLMMMMMPFICSFRNKNETEASLAVASLSSCFSAHWF